MVSCFLLEKNSGETFQIDQGGSPFEGGLVFPAKRGILIRSGGFEKVLPGLSRMRMGCRKTANLCLCLYNNFICEHADIRGCESCKKSQRDLGELARGLPL